MIKILPFYYYLLTDNPPFQRSMRFFFLKGGGNPLHKKALTLDFVIQVYCIYADAIRGGKQCKYNYNS